jgi:hypothetical protein
MPKQPANEPFSHSTIAPEMHRTTWAADFTDCELLLPVLKTSSAEQPQATGTDQALPCVVPDVATNGGNPVSSHVFSPVLAAVTAEPAADRIVRPSQHLPDEQRTSEKKRKVRAQGLEPWTYGLKVRCSTN